jgi:recombination protein RecT
MLVRESTHSGIEVYMARRSSRSAFMPDAYVFPGGAVDADDASESTLARLDEAPAGVEPEFAVAAIRELFEEAGIFLGLREDGAPVESDELTRTRTALASGGLSFGAALERNGWRLCGNALTYYSRWITPPAELSRRFDARFFVAQAPQGQAAAADAVEMHDGLWIRAAEALARGERGEWTLVFPTLRHLERLTVFTSLDDLEAHARTRRPVPIMPEVARDGVISLPPELQAW